MPRPKRASNARGSRNSGKMSGVTYLSIPSGVTITKENKVETTDGYMLQHDTANEMQKCGHLDFAGASKVLTPADLCLTTLKHLMLMPISSGSTSPSGASVIPTIHTAKPGSDLSDATQVVVYCYTGNGGSIDSGVSLAYLAIGV